MKLSETVILEKLRDNYDLMVHTTNSINVCVFSMLDTLEYIDSLDKHSTEYANEIRRLKDNAQFIKKEIEYLEGNQ